MYEVLIVPINEVITNIIYITNFTIISNIVDSSDASFWQPQLWYTIISGGFVILGIFIAFILESNIKTKRLNDQYYLFIAEQLRVEIKRCIYIVESHKNNEISTGLLCIDDLPQYISYIINPKVQSKIRRIYRNLDLIYQKQLRSDWAMAISFAKDKINNTNENNEDDKKLLQLYNEFIDLCEENLCINSHGVCLRSKNVMNKNIRKILLTMKL